jgi:hypothetical protein
VAAAGTRGLALVICISCSVPPGMYVRRCGLGNRALAALRCAADWASCTLDWGGGLVCSGAGVRLSMNEGGGVECDGPLVNLISPVARLLLVPLLNYPIPPCSILQP